MADLVITVGNVLAASTAVVAIGVAAESLSAGQVIYKDATNSNKITRADANAGAATSAAVGITLHAALAGQPIQYIVSGGFNPGATVAVGTIYIVSSAAGGIAPSSDLASTWYTTILGIATTTTNINVQINSGGVAVP